MMEPKSKSFDAINIIESNKALLAKKFHHDWINSESGKQFKKELQESDKMLLKKLEEIEQKLYICRTQIAYMAADKLHKDLKAAIQDQKEFNRVLAEADKLDEAQKAKETDVKNGKSKKGFWSKIWPKIWSKFCCGKHK